jgi:hypothetical protein
VHRAGAAQSRAAAEFAALQVEFVAQHPKQRHVAVDIDGSINTVDLDRVGHVSSLPVQILDGAPAFGQRDPPGQAYAHRRSDQASIARGSGTSRPETVQY